MQAWAKISIQNRGKSLIMSFLCQSQIKMYIRTADERKFEVRWRCYGPLQRTRGQMMHILVESVLKVISQSNCISYWTAWLTANLSSLAVKLQIAAATSVQSQNGTRQLRSCPLVLLSPGWPAWLLRCKYFEFLLHSGLPILRIAATENKLQACLALDLWIRTTFSELA